MLDIAYYLRRCIVLIVLVSMILQLLVSLVVRSLFPKLSISHSKSHLMVSSIDIQELIVLSEITKWLFPNFSKKWFIEERRGK